MGLISNNHEDIVIDTKCTKIKLKFIRGSFLGRVVYHITRHKYFGYKEEDLSFLLPSRYYDYYSHNLNGNFIGRRDEDLKEVQEIEKRYPALCNPILVDWDGPEDLENPNNWPFYIRRLYLVFKYPLIHFQFMCVQRFMLLRSPKLVSILELANISPLYLLNNVCYWLRHWPLILLCRKIVGSEEIIFILPPCLSIQFFRFRQH